MTTIVEQAQRTADFAAKRAAFLASRAAELSPMFPKPTLPPAGSAKPLPDPASVPPMPVLPVRPKAATAPTPTRQQARLDVLAAMADKPDDLVRRLAKHADGDVRNAAAIVLAEREAAKPDTAPIVEKRPDGMVSVDFRNGGGRVFRNEAEYEAFKARHAR